MAGRMASAMGDIAATGDGTGDIVVGMMVGGGIPGPRRFPTCRIITAPSG